MTISELIEELKSIKEEHGDLVVGIQDDDGMVQFDVCVAKSYYLDEDEYSNLPIEDIEEKPYCDIFIGHD